jgi:hypothetical protein
MASFPKVSPKERCRFSSKISGKFFFSSKISGKFFHHKVLVIGPSGGQFSQAIGQLVTRQARQDKSSSHKGNHKKMSENLVIMFQKGPKLWSLNGGKIVHEDL